MSSISAFHLLHKQGRVISAAILAIKAIGPAQPVGVVEGVGIGGMGGGGGGRWEETKLMHR